MRAASATSPEAVAVGLERASTAAACVPDFLNQLADDELLRVLSHLGVTDLCRLAQACKHCMELATCDLSWALHVQELLSDCKIDRHSFEGDFLYGTIPRLPKYDGPPLRMPYLTPVTYGQNTTACEIRDQGLQYLCSPSAILKPEIDDLVWITCSFPVKCCGAQHATRAEFEEHILDMRHYERMAQEHGEGWLPDICVDPRLHRPNTFDALSKREQYLRMRRYVDAILPRIHARCDPASWSVADKANLQALSSQGLSFMEQIERTRRTPSTRMSSFTSSMKNAVRCASRPSSVRIFVTRCSRASNVLECMSKSMPSRTSRCATFSQAASQPATRTADRPRVRHGGPG